MEITIRKTVVAFLVYEVVYDDNTGDGWQKSHGIYLTLEGAEKARLVVSLPRFYV